MKTLVVVSHPFYQQSRVTKALVEAIAQVKDVEIRHIDALYGTDFNAIDIVAEQKAHENADRIVYLFPIHWFNLTPMLKAYMNAVWAYNWAFGPEGYALADKELQIIASAGAAAETYTPEGLIQHTPEDILSPLEASAYYCSMKYNQPIVFHGSNAVDEQGLAQWQEAVKTRLNSPLASHLRGVSARKKA